MLLVLFDDVKVDFKRRYDNIIQSWLGYEYQVLLRVQFWFGRFEGVIEGKELYLEYDIDIYEIQKNRDMVGLRINWGIIGNCSRSSEKKRLLLVSGVS